MGKEGTVVDGEVGDGFEGANVRELPHVLVRIARAGLDQRREIPNSVDRRAGQQEAKQRGEIKSA